MAARLIKRGLGRELTLGLGGDLSLGGSIDQCLQHSVDDAAERQTARRLQQQHPCLKRGMRSSEVWGDCVADLQCDISMVSLTCPITARPSQTARGQVAGKRRRQRAHPLNLEVLLDVNIDFTALANEAALDFREVCCMNVCLTCMGPRISTVLHTQLRPMDVR